MDSLWNLWIFAKPYASPPAGGADLETRLEYLKKQYKMI